MGAALPARFTRGVLAQYRLLWLLVLCAAMAGVLGGSSRVDNLFYDRLLNAVDTPAADDVLMVVVDDNDIAQLGYWPWRRVYHARLLDQLASARAVGLDIIFAEYSTAYPGDDAVLAEAIRRHGRVVLPLVLPVEPAQTPILPIASLASTANALGFINIVPDEDSVVRSVSLAQLDDGREVAHFALALLRAGGQAQVADQALQRVRASGYAPMLIPYGGSPGHVRMVSYRAVLRGEVPREEIANKYVLIGTWATGVGDIFHTPVSERLQRRMAGVEIIANVLQAVRQGHSPVKANAWQRALFSALPVALLCLLLPRRSPTQAILSCITLMAATLTGSVVLLHGAQIWLAPSAALFMLMLCYPVWAWRSQEAVLRHLNAELHRLNREAPLELDQGPTVHGDHSLESRFAELLSALGRVRNLRRFLTDSLHGMPDATLLVDDEGRLKFFNHAAAAHFHRRGMSGISVIDQPVDAVLASIITDAEVRQRVVEAIKAPPHRLAHASPWSVDLEVRDVMGQLLMLRCAPVRTASNQLAGAIITLTDITAIATAEQQREETLRFISHDMRAPQNSILALIALQRDNATPEQREALTRIDVLVHRTLRLVDDFVGLSSAQTAKIEPRIVDLADLLQSATDELWAQARQKRIRILYTRPAAPAVTLGDDDLLLRALRNLLDNAIKYSPDGTDVTCTLTSEAQHWEIRIIDQGPGVAQDDLENIFKPFVRRNTQVAGTGLGLAFVRLVATRHKGRVDMINQPGGGACFVLCLPRHG